MTKLDLPALAQEMLSALDQARLVTPPTERWPGLDFVSAYIVAAELTSLRRARGEQPIGRKIGYTNRNIWPQYHVHQPIWGHVYRHTVQYASNNAARLSLTDMVAPRIEPEIAFKLREPLSSGETDPASALQSIDWIARTFEIVDCHYADWEFRGPDSVIDFSHHAALIIGTPQEVRSIDIEELVSTLRDCQVSLTKDGHLADTGVGANALGHPALALIHLAGVIASQPDADPLRPGEIITTGTLTAALPVQSGETWCTETQGLGLAPLTVQFD